MRCLLKNLSPSILDAAGNTGAIGRARVCVPQFKELTGAQAPQVLNAASLWLIVSDGVLYWSLPHTTDYPSATGRMIRSLRVGVIFPCTPS